MILWCRWTCVAQDFNENKSYIQWVVLMFKIRFLDCNKNIISGTKSAFLFYLGLLASYLPGLSRSEQRQQWVRGI